MTMTNLLYTVIHEARDENGESALNGPMHAEQARIIANAVRENFAVATRKYRVWELRSWDDEA